MNVTNLSADTTHSKHATRVVTGPGEAGAAVQYPQAFVRTDETPGLVMEGVEFEQLPNHGRPCWRATARIGSIFGAEVDGELHGIGATQEQALERLRDEQRRLHDSLFE